MRIRKLHGLTCNAYFNRYVNLWLHENAVTPLFRDCHPSHSNAGNTQHERLSKSIPCISIELKLLEELFILVTFEAR